MSVESWEGMEVYVVSDPDDGSRTPAKLVEVTEWSARVKYPHVGGVFTFRRTNVRDENDKMLTMQGFKKNEG